MRCLKEIRVPVRDHDEPDLDLGTIGFDAAEEISTPTIDIQCIHQHGHPGPHVAYRYGGRLAWTEEGG